MDYYRFKITCASSLCDILIAFLATQAFDTFEESTDGLNAYLPASSALKEMDIFLQDLQKRFDFQYEKEWVPYQNWNAKWESNFQPLQVREFCGVRATFHPPFTNTLHEIIIDPKMAFGTGHHATTYMMLDMMETLVFDGFKVLDYGCGTGILAILASKMGASVIEAVDIDILSYDNTIENCGLNGVKNVSTFHGVLQDVPSSKFDVILANINRNVILESLPALVQLLRPSGNLVISGVLQNDLPILQTNFEKVGLSIKSQLEKEGWQCLLLNISTFK